MMLYCEIINIIVGYKILYADRVRKFVYKFKTTTKYEADYKRS